MESKRNSKKRSLNEYRQSKDYGYSRKRNVEKQHSRSDRYKKFYEDIRESNRNIGNDQELGGYVRRILRRYYERFSEE